MVDFVSSDLRCIDPDYRHLDCKGDEMITYTVTFKPGRYKVVLANELQRKKHGQTGLVAPTWIVGREDDGKVIGFFFEEDAAKAVCFAMNLADAHLRGDTMEERNLLRQFEKARDVH